MKPRITACVLHFTDVFKTLHIIYKLVITSDSSIGTNNPRGSCPFHDHSLTVTGASGGLGKAVAEAVLEARECIVATASVLEITRPAILLLNCSSFRWMYL